MIQNELTYLNLLRDVMENGSFRKDRTGVGVKSVFGRQSRYNLRNDAFPLLTTKKMLLGSIVSELLWFIEGSGDERRLAEIRYGKNRSELLEKRTIWTDNAEAPYWTPKAQFEGDLGRVYGVQWRRWQTAQPTGGEIINTKNWRVGHKTKTVDQLADLIEGIKRDPYGRRHILTAWNPGELDQMALPPCHVLCQFYVDGDELSCLLYQRSNDLFLGSPYNIASYALFTKMIAQVCGLKAGDLVYSQGDTHIYQNHFEAVNEQLDRTPFAEPTIWVDPSITEIDDFRMTHFELRGYEAHPVIKAKMAV